MMRSFEVLLFLCVLHVIDSATRDCVHNEFKCRDGACIQLRSVCDGQFDCADHSDEDGCDYKMCRGPNWFKCTDGTCIEKSFICDGLYNCPDGDDELKCEGYHMTEHVPCEKDEFTCSDKVCIPIDFTCDGKQDCADNSDETVGCTDIESRCHGFLCKNRHCLESAEWVCDGQDDCGDGSDEVGCVNNCKIEKGQFRCKDTCIPLSNVCNKVQDCPDGSDENGLCSSGNTNCGSLKCPGKCIQLPKGPECVCPEGFTYNEAKNSCEDIDECQIYGICSQGCVNTVGSYRCTCADKFKLRPDGKSCAVENAEPLLLYTTQHSVVGLYLKSRHMYYAAKNLSQVIGVTYDGNYIYWTDITAQSESIVRAREDGSHQEVILTAGIETPEDIAVDWLTGNIYFTDNLYKHLAVCSSDGYKCLVLIVENVDQPRGIALHPRQGSMFWTDWGRVPMIGKASMDGRNAHQLVSTNIHWPNGLALDIPNRRLYWVDAKIGTIQSVRLDGSDRQTVLDKIPKHPYGIAVFEDRIYWSDWETKGIHTCHKFTGKHHKIIARDKAVYAVHIYHSAIQQKGNHACMNSMCSHLCLLSANVTYSCACPEGMELGIDHLTCKDAIKREILFLGVGNYLVEIKHTSFGRHQSGNGTPLPMFIHRMEYNTNSGKLFIADNIQRAIYEVDLSTKEFKALIKDNIANVSALSYDNLADNLYWSDSIRHTIEVYSMRNKMRAIVHHFAGSDAPIALSVIPTTGQMFIALKSNQHSHIDMQSMHGRGMHIHLFEDNIGTHGVEMVSSPKAEQIYILDSEKGTIRFTSFNGSTPYLFRSRLRNPVSITLIEDDIAWSIRGSDHIYWTHRSNLESIRKFKLEKPPSTGLPEEIALASSKPLAVIDHPCRHDNGGCSHVCVSMGKFSSGCLCPPGFVFRDYTNTTCIEALDCEFRCRSGECLTASRRCNGHKDCADGSDEEKCDPSSKKGPKITCSVFEFTCHDGTQCILQEQRCDKNFNCKDKSDEDHCEHFNHSSICHKYQFTCSAGGCVDLTTLCDGHKDCDDGSDERICQDVTSTLGTCGKDMFRCVSGSCIPNNWECDGHIDCTDGSDEHGKCVSQKCPEGSFKCPLGHCIDKTFICDGRNDCGDETDEKNCEPQRRQIVCGDSDDDMGDPSQYQCPSEPTKCLPITALCNGTAECPRGEDEADCSNCNVREFECKTPHKCIRLEFRCDNERDCEDGSDEINCTMYRNSSRNFYTRTCHDDMFDCKDGTCTDKMRVCDGRIDCPNGSDESAKCKTACNGHPCDQKCIPSPYGPVCGCRDGFVLASDKRTCIDLNECQEMNPCAQICENTIGSFRCSCYPGFMLHLDKNSCKSISNKRFLLFTTSNQIRKLSDNPVAMEILWHANESFINGIDFSAAQNTVYFTVQDTGAIYQLNMTNKAVRLIPDVGNPTKLAVDWITNNIYFIDQSDYYSIKVCHFHEKLSPCVRLIKHSPRDIIKSIAVDPINKYLFYSVMHLMAFGPSETIIYRVSMDGSGREVLTSRGRFVTAMDCDIYKKRLYYAELTTKSIHSVSYTGQDEDIVIKRHRYIENPSGLSVYENHAYIINRGIQEAVKCQLYGEKECQAFNINVYNAEDITIFGASKQKNVTNVCESHQCSLICVQAERGPKCLCPGGVHASEGAACDSSESDKEGHRETAVHSGPISSESGTSNSTIAMAVCFSLIALIAAALLGYYWYRRRQCHGKFNIYMHFQNPMAETDGRPSSGDDGVEVKMRRPSVTATRGRHCDTCPPEKMCPFPQIRSLFKQSTSVEDSDSETASRHEFENDAKERLVL